jgi:hypothetical protein
MRLPPSRTCERQLLVHAEQAGVAQIAHSHSTQPGATATGLAYPEMALLGLRRVDA